MFASHVSTQKLEVHHNRIVIYPNQSLVLKNSLDPKTVRYYSKKRLSLKWFEICATTKL